MRAWWARNGLGLMIAGATLLIMGLAVGACTYAFINTPGLHDGSSQSSERAHRYNPRSRSRAPHVP